MQSRADVREYYRKRLHEVDRLLLATMRRQSLLTLLRLACFVGLSYSIYQTILGTSDWWIVTVFCLVAFIISLRFYFLVKDRRRFLEQLREVNRNELHVFDGGMNKYDDGRRFIESASYGLDLDVYGPRSLYHGLNRTATYEGSALLASYLAHPVDKDEILSRQRAVDVLAALPGLRQDIQALGVIHSTQQGVEGVFTWLDMPNLFLGIRIMKWVRWLLPSINLALFLHLLNGGVGFPLLITYVVSGFVLVSNLRLINEQHRLLSAKYEQIAAYARILHEFGNKYEGSSELLDRLRDTALEGVAHVRQLAQLVNFFDQRMNLFVVMVNPFFLFDIQIMMELEKWKLKNRGKFRAWIEAVATIEALVSLGTFRFNHPDFVMPATATESIIEAKGLGHPLIASDRRVDNDFIIGQTDRLHLVTGSNMSGKTTFLRAVGVNMILACCGAPVCAHFFRFWPCRILSSIRVSDSLQENTSYFMAELKKLAFIIQELEAGKPALVLIDEILRGTNSDDKSHGSELYIKKLLQYNCLTLFATHDLSLGALEQQLPGIVANYCFESRIEQDELFFDYRLRRGIAQNKNASFLMHKMGIV